VQLQDTVSARLSVKAHWALAVAEVESGKLLVNAGNAVNTPLIPGSLMKLFVTAAILERNMLKAIDLRTVVAVSGEVKKNRLKGDVVVKGSGNPFLSTKDVRQAVEKIKSLGIKEIAGDIVVNDSLFDVKGWKSRYEGPAYGKPFALGLDLHTVSITADGPKQRVVIDPPNDGVKVSFNPAGKPGVRQIDDLTYEVTGAVQDAPIVRNRFSLIDPALYAGGTFMTLLKQAGIKIEGTVRRGFLTAEAKEISRAGTNDMSNFIRDMNQQSLNVAADNLLFLLGAQTFGAPGTREKGIQAVNDFLGKLGMPQAGMVIDDGSGVSERNRVSAQQMVAFLRSAAGKPWFKTFYDSLSRPGMDGRLKDFGYRSDRIRAKSGQVREAYGLEHLGDVDAFSAKRLILLCR
jgi:D-alanyl-D-alanine carboxypeptidase/D-alanyl-D-alanine-endopeptidase (penicillin-binding protein 4)